MGRKILKTIAKYTEENVDTDRVWYRIVNESDGNLGYSSSKTAILIQCLICNNFHRMKPSRILLDGTSCTCCSKNYNKEIRDTLSEMGYNVKDNTLEVEKCFVVSEDDNIELEQTGNNEVQTISPSKNFSKKMLDDIISNLNSRKIFNNNRTSPFDILFNRHYLLEDTLAIKSDEIKNEPVEKAFYVGDFVRIKNDVNKSITYKKKSDVNNFKNEIYRVYKKYFNKDQQLFTYKVASIFGDFVYQRPFYYEEMIPVSSRILKNTYVDEYSYKPLNQTEKNFLGYLEVDYVEN